MTLEGYIAVNAETNKVLVDNSIGDVKFGWVFKDLEELCDFAYEHRLTLEDYVIHHIGGAVLEFEVTTRRC